MTRTTDKLLSLGLAIVWAGKCSSFAPAACLPKARQQIVPTQNSPSFQQRITNTELCAVAVAPGSSNLPKVSSSSLAPEDAWVANLDYEAFGKDVSDLGKRLKDEGSNDDVEHLNKMVSWRNNVAMFGVATMWMSPNPLTVAALSMWTYTTFGMIAHHTCHGGYNRFDAGIYQSRSFATGTFFRRFRDWLDWMLPEAWNIEHNRLHHYRLNEGNDPDLVENNLTYLRNKDSPMALKYLEVAFVAVSWKWFYYGPNTYKELKLSQMAREGKQPPKDFVTTDAVTVLSYLMPRTASEQVLPEVVSPWELFSKVTGPFFFVRFILLPAPLLAVPDVGPQLFLNAFTSLVLADLLTNAHAFLTIVTNHAGDDMYKFDDSVKPKSPSFYVRQIVGSTNYNTGSDLVDFSQGWLNYQIEHHCMPDLSLLQYQKAAPQLKAICEKHGVPYVQQNAFLRLKKTVDIMVGKTDMRPFPTEFEPAKDKARNGIQWKTTHGAIDED